MVKKCIIYLGYNDPREYKRGVENVILSQSRALGIDVDKYYFFCSSKDEVFDWEDITCISFKNSAFRYLNYNKTIRKIRVKYQDVFIHSHDFIASLFLIYNIDCMTVHDGLYYLRRESKHKLRFLHYVVEKIVFYKVKRTHFISEFTKSKTLYPVNKTDYSIIPNTTPFEFIKNCNSIPHKQFSSKLNLFTVRGIQERTRIDLLVDLATTVKQSKLDIHIFVAGKGELLDFYKADVCERGLEEYITFLGYVSDLEVASYYASCDLVIVPAEYGEGFGLPIIEGYCFDKPVIASNVCAIPEVIIDKEHLFNNNTSSIFRLIDSFYRSSKNNSERVYIDYYKENFAESVIHKLYNEEIYR